MAQLQDAGTEDSGRPKRNKKQSLKAQEIQDSGKSVPGLPPSDTSPRSVAALHFSTTSSAASAGRMSSASGVFATVIGMKHHAISIPTFEANDFMIYNWKLPRPTNFTHLPDYHRAWKRETDRQEQARDIDDGSDDWDEFCGDPTMYPDRRGDGHEMCRCIGRTFVNRAKRAFWAGKSWMEFEAEERTIDSDYHARAERNLKKRAALLDAALDNGLRLVVFEVLKVRLCEEIWLQRYGVSTSTSEPPRAREDSKIPTPAPNLPAVFDPRHVRAGPAPTIEEMSRGITGWAIDPLDIEQPLYGNESEPPNGMRNFMEDMREQLGRERKETGRTMYDTREGIGERKNHAQGGGIRFGNVGVTRMVPMTAAEEVAKRPPDLGSSGEAEER